MKKIIVFILIFLSVFSNNMLYANQNSATTNLNQKSNDKLSIDMIKKDVDFIVNWIETHHPEIIKYGFSEEQRNTIDFVYKNIDKDMSKNEFFFIINRLFAMLNDGHCILYYYPQTTLYLDIPFVWLEEGIIITQNINDFKIGDKILSIGNKSESELISLIKQQVSSENIYWLRKKAYEILTSKAYLENFKLMNNDGSVDIKILRKEKNDEASYEKILDFNVKLKDSLTSNINLPIIRNSNEWIDWYIEKDNNLAYFRFDNWPPRGEKHEELKKQLDNFFSEVFKNNIRNIAFDIRRNPGGNAPILDDILSYLKTDKIYSASYEEYNQYVPKKDKLFDGSVYFLTSNQSFSCSVYALTILKDNKIVKTIGEPTGQKPAFNFHGEGSDSMLPNTGWEFMMTSELNTRPMDIEPEDSLYPDIAVNTTRDDILNSSDAQMFKLRQISNPSLKKNIIKEQVFVAPNGNITIKNSDCFNIDMKNRTINLHFSDDKIKKEDINFFLVEENLKALVYTIAPDNKTATINIDIKSKIGEKYLLIVNAVDHIEYHIEFVVNDFKVKNYSHTKFGYMLFYFSENIKDIREYKLIVSDENGKPLDISAAKVVENGDSLLLNLSSKFKVGNTYKLYIPKNTILLTNGSYNNEDIYLDFIIKN